MSDTCHSIEPLLSLYADGMAATAERRLVEEHLPHCADCRADLAWIQVTHQTLAARPIMAPPADLQARIAEAIAASSPAPLRPAHIFTLRPAYAAAASLTVLGVVLIAALPHLLSPIPPTSVVRPHTLPSGAVSRSAMTPFAVKHGSVVASSHHDTQSHLNVHPAASVVEHLESAPKPARVSLPLPEPMPDHQVATAVRTAPSVSSVKPTVQHSHLHPGAANLQIASHLSVTEPKHLSAPLSITPSAHKSVMEASLPKTPPTVPVNIGPSTVTTQPDAPRVHMASDILGDVRASAIRMQNAGFATVIKSTNHVALNLSRSNVSDAAVEPITSGDFH